MSDGYVFDYSGVTTSKKRSDPIPGSVTKLQLVNKFGNVEVTHDPTKPLQWEWEAKVWADEEDRSREFLSEMELLVTGDESLVMELKLPESDSELNGVKSNLTINLPAGVELVSTNSHGGTSVTNMSQKIDVTNKHGNISALNVAEAKIECSHGDLTLDYGLEKLLVKCWHGDVRANHVNNVTVEGSHSDILITNVIGNCKLETEHGDMVLANCRGDLTLKNQHGDIRAKKVFGNIEAVSSFGDLAFAGQCSVLKVNNEHGSIRAELTNVEFDSIKMVTTFDDITLILPSDADVKMVGGAKSFADKFQPSSGAAKVDLDASHGDVKVKTK
jgi:hypothetical protein